MFYRQYIQVYPAKVKAFGVEQTALRIRPIVPTNGYDMEQYKNQLANCKSLDELKQAYMSLPNNIKSELAAFKDQIKNNDFILLLVGQTQTTYHLSCELIQTANHEIKDGENIYEYLEADKSKSYHI